MKKKALLFRGKEFIFLRHKILRIMKLSVFLLLLSMSCAFASESYSQKALINLHLKNAQIKEVFKEIENQSEFFFLYSPDIINEQKRIDIESENESINKVLDEVFAKSTLDYLIMDRQIIISDRNLLNSNKNRKYQRQLTGVVTDENEAPLIGVSVVVKGTTVGVITNQEGIYTINANVGDTLIFSYIGYEDQYVAVGNQTEINIQMQADFIGLSEIVIVGYGTQQKAKVTGSVATVGGEELAQKTVPDVRQALQGEVTGVTIIDRGDVPGKEDMEITIRGITSLSSNTQPLVLVDGIVMPMHDVDPNDIESMSVLKDAASCAIYGAQAANGVILIKTKRGSNKGFNVDYNAYWSVQSPASTLELIGPRDYLELVNESLVNAGLSPKYTEDYIQNTVAGTDPIEYPYNNLFEEIYNPAWLSNHSLSFRGGTDRANIAFSANYLDHDGMIAHVNSKRYGFRLNTDFKLHEKFAINANVSYNARNNTEPNRLWSAKGDIIGTAPTTVLKYPNGAYGLNKDNSSALAGIEEGGTNLQTKNRMNIQTGFDWEIFSGLHLLGNLSYKDFNMQWKNYTSEFDFYSSTDVNDIVVRWAPSSLDQGEWIENETNLRMLLKYSREFNGHSVQVLGGYDVTDNQATTMWAERSNIYSDDYVSLNMGDELGQTNGGYDQGWGLISYLGRVNYAYDTKYLFEANFRYDGSSRFAEGNRWGFFPSFSAGWLVSREDFMSSLEFLNKWKLRGSWGQLGNQNIGLYRYSSTVYSDYAYNYNDVVATGYSQRYYANSDISWETTEMLNFGTDISFFNNKIEITADWFKKLTKDVLLTLPISPMVGLGASETNAGTITNQGWELSVTHKSRINDLFYSIGFNISDVKNELSDFAGKEPAIWGWTILKEGEQIYSLYGYEANGLFQSEEEIAEHPTQPNHANLKPGDIKLIDQNGDGEINDEDKVVIGSTIPRFTYGINLSANFRGIDFKAFLQGVGNVQNYFYGEVNEGPAFEVFSTPAVLDRWTPDNPDATFPRLEAGSNKNNSLYNSFWVRDASYFRLKNVQLGYTLPSSWVKKVHLDKTRIYVSGTNLFTITDVDKGIDPETYDGRYYAYPPVKSITFGVQLTF